MQAFVVVGLYKEENKMVDGMGVGETLLALL
jgi:hypothetical protein